MFVWLLDISGGEFLVILVVVLMLFGAKSIPELARGLGRGIREFRDATNQIKREISDTGEQIKKEMDPGIPRSLDQFIDEREKPVFKPIAPPSDPEPQKNEMPSGDVPPELPAQTSENRPEEEQTDLEEKAPES